MSITNKFSYYKTRRRNDKKVRMEGLFSKTVGENQEGRCENLGPISTRVPNVFSPTIMKLPKSETRELSNHQEKSISHTRES